MKDVPRCINIDWLEIYALEDSLTYPHNASYFEQAGFYVVQREYGTRNYNEMFTLYGTDNLPLLEIRRAPKSVAGISTGGVMDRFACHIRLCNRSCYLEDCAGLLLQFCEQYGFAIQRISRLDICLDFEKFDTGDDPQKFLQRYIAGVYSKINQAKIAVHGLDRWDGRSWNSIKWGQPTSMVSTKLYNKTMELREAHDKPYIRQSWRAAGLIDDWHNMTKYDKDGNEYTPNIWRLEFSICSSTKNWFVIEDPYSTRRKLRSIHHTLDMYHTRRQMLDIFVSLCDHYFHFKHYETGKRKDRCRDKQLFRFDLPSTFYKLTHIATSDSKNHHGLSLISKLEHLANTTLNHDVQKACWTIIELLRQRQSLHDYSQPLDENEVELLRRVIAWRVKHHDAPLADDIAYYKELLQLEDNLFTG